MVTVIYEPTRACVQREILGSQRLRAGLPCSFGCIQGLPSSVPSSLCPWGSTLLLSSRKPPRPATQSWPCFFPSLSLHQSHQNLNFCLIFPPLLKLPSSWFSIIKAIAFPWGIWWYLSPLWSFTGWLSKQLLEPSIRHTITQCSFVQTSLGMFPISFLLELCMCASFPSLT